ncbi:MAG: arginine--tRNA ligase [Candidatus Aenigmatarchaeota archaeon]
MNPKTEFLEECKLLTRPHANPSLLEVPPNNIADLALPCFSLSKKLKKDPADIANELSVTINKKIKKNGLIKTVRAMGPYVNFYTDDIKFSKLVIAMVLKQKKLYGSGKKKNKKIMIEFAHPNTHKAFHIGHVRNISLGESISRILEFNGYKVTRTNYQGDIGPHVAKCLWGYMHLGKKEPDNLEEKGKWLGLLYAEASKKVKNDLSIAEQVAEINKKIYNGDKKLTEIWKKTRLWSLRYFDKIYEDFGTKFDKLYFESHVTDLGLKTVKRLLRIKKAKMSEGAVIIELGKELGNFLLLKSDGTPLYSTKDLGLVQMEFKDFKPDEILHVVANEQDLYFRQLFATFKIINKLWYEKSRHLSYSLVILKSGKMSSREGDVILYDDLLEKLYLKALETLIEKDRVDAKDIAHEIALAAIKYGMLKIDNQRTITFDWEEALSIEGDTGPYLQYTHARANSILQRASKTKKTNISSLDRKEILLVKKMSDFPSVVEKSCRETKPSLMANYLHELAAIFNEFYQTTRVIDSDNESFRLNLVNAFKITIANGLNLLGIKPLEKI